ncbi:unnamed protein product [Vicia faba]|uniref:Replication factor A C-terminal domain-containing protein n=1 Tax=Vicia faba TaxID=3906 RepID=A0AAV1B244_VICFA|nr:unnamed protein product [Vicia faba]
MNYQNPDQFAAHTIGILTHAWCKQNTISGLPSLSNAWNCSRLYINLEHPQVESFKASFGTTDLANQYALSLTRDSFIHSTNKNWTSPKEVKSIREIYEGGKDCYATTIGTTLCFKASKFGWYFESCPGCKSSNKSQGSIFHCDCGVKDVEPVLNYRFKIEIEVEYDSHKGTFVFLDKDCKPYTKMTAKELRQLMKEAGEDNPKIWPAHLDNLLNREMEFRINKSLMHLLWISPVKSQCRSPTNLLCPTTSSSSTPAKRIAITTSVNNLLEAEDLTPKQSVTKGKPGRKMKHLKKE